MSSSELICNVLSMACDILPMNRLLLPEMHAAAAMAFLTALDQQLAPAAQLDEVTTPVNANFISRIRRSELSNDALEASLLDRFVEPWQQ